MITFSISHIHGYGYIISCTHDNSIAPPPVVSGTHYTPGTGVFLPGAIHTEGEGTLETMMATNVYSAYHLTRAVLPMMFNYQKGHIFNICSVASKKAYPNGGSYSISKFALLGLSHNLREELKPKGIKVTAILPGATWSDSWAGFEAPEERLMQARDVAEVIVAALRMSVSAVMEEVTIRPQLGDL